MCGRFALTHTTEELADLFAAEVVAAPVTPRYNIAPTQPVAVLVHDPGRVLEAQRWGLMPPWSKGPENGPPLVNARAETLASRPAFRQALRHRRCLIPASGFYEWRNVGRQRLPLYITPADGRPLVFAGLWETWHDAQGRAQRSCAIITVPANTAVAVVHDRMPALLGPAAAEQWLIANRPESAAALLVPWPSDDLVLRPVSPRVNHVGHDAPDCLDPLPPQAAAMTPGRLF
jgi:putative SOS response-associated peptidase YedK